MKNYRLQTRSAMMPLQWLPISLSLAVGTAVTCRAEDLPAKVTFDTHIKPLFREHCTSCHNAIDKKSGLALDNYDSTMAGGSGGELLVAGDLESSRMWALSSHAEQPKMPPNQDRMSDAKLALLKRWIEQGMPENDGSEIMAPKVDLSAMGVVSQSRPEGKPPMPESMLKQTPLYTQRPAAISALAASPWSPLIAVGGQEQIVLYHSESGELLGILPFPEGEPQSITFSRDGKLILVGGGRHAHSGFAVLYEIQTGRRITRVGDELDIVMAADLSEDNSKIALGGPQKILRIYETATGKLVHELKKHTDWIYAVRFSPDGLLVASADRSNGLFVWESESGRFFLDLIGHKGEVRSVAWRPDSLALVSGSLDGTLKLWDMNEGKLIKSWDAHGGGALAVAICNDGTIASTGQDKKVRLWTAAGAAAGEMPNLVEAGMEIAITVDAKQVVAGDWLGNVRLWDKADPKHELQLKANPSTLQQAIQVSEKSLSNLVARRKDEARAWKDFEAKLDMAKNVVTENERRIAVAKSKVDAGQNATQLAAKNAAKADALLKAALSKVEGDRQLLQSKADQLAILKSKEQDTVAMEAEIVAIKKSIDEQDRSISNMRLGVVEKKSAVAVLQFQIKELIASMSKLEKDREASIAAHQALEKESLPVKAKLDIADKEISKQQKRLDGLRQDLALFLEAKEQWTARADAVEALVAKLDQQRLVAESGLEAEESNRKTGLEKLDSLKKQIEQLQQSIAQLSKQTAQSEQTITAKRSAVEAIGSELSQLKAEHQSISLQLQAYSQPAGN